MVGSPVDYREDLTRGRKTKYSLVDNLEEKGLDSLVDLE